MLQCQPQRQLHPHHGSEETLVIEHEQYLAHNKLDKLESTTMTSQQLNSEKRVGA
jgi:hypothetical protein